MADPPRGGVARRSFLSAVAAVPFLSTGVASGDSNSQVHIEETDSVVTIGNDLIEVTVRRDNGGIKQIRAVDRDLSLREPDEERPALAWSLQFYSDDYLEVRTASVRAGTPTIEATAQADCAEMKIEWTNPSLHSEGEVIGDFDGVVTTRASVKANEPFLSWRLEIENKSNWAIKSASCPHINGITSLGSADADELVVPRGLGRRYRNPVETLDSRENIPTHRYPSGLGTMQFTAYYGPTGGFYFDARDTAGYTKELLWRRDEWREGPLEYRMQHHTPRHPGADFSLPYPATVEILHGDWFDAADRYREWLLSEGWLPTDDPGPAKWVRNLGAVFRARSYTRPDFPDPLPDLSYEFVVETMAEAADILDVPLGLRWRGWQKYGDPAGLDWFPPKEGWDSFEQAVNRLENHDVSLINIHLHNYVLERSDFWTENHSRATDWLTRERDGSRYRFPLSDAYRFYRVEFPQSGWQQELLSRLLRLAEAGTRAHQLDGFPWSWVPECYAEHHDHPLGFGGNWFAQSSKEALENLKQKVRAKRSNFTLGGEAICDFYMPEMDIGMFRDALAERFEEPATNRESVAVIPLLPYALGDHYTTWTGTISPALALPDDSPAKQDYHRLAVGRSLVWGSIPLVSMPKFLINDPGDTARPVWKYLKVVAAARGRWANRFVAHGEMLRPPKVDTETVTIETTNVRATTPEILTSAWRSPIGEIGIVFTNISPREESQSIDIDLSAQPTALPDEPWLVYMVNNGRYKRIGGIQDETTSLTLELDQSDVVLLVISSADEVREHALETLIEAQTEAKASEISMVEQAKRRFEAGKLAEATEIAESVIEGDPSPSEPETNTESDQPSIERTGEQSPAETGTKRTTADTPGFTMVTGLAGIAAAVTALLRRGDRDQ